MPTFVRLVVTVVVSLSCSVAWSQYGNRYPDRNAQTNEAPPASEVEQAIPEPISEPLAAPPAAWQEPAGPRPTRKLPFRFVKADAVTQPSKVIRASATEPVSTPLSPPKSEKGLALRPESKGASSKRSTAIGLTSLPTMLGSVGIVVGLFLIVAWMAKRGMPKQPPLLPREALEVLGRQRFGGKQEMQLLRLGNKLVLVHIVPGHVESLAEVTDPAEVDRLTGICYQGRPNSSSRNFQETFQQFALDRPAPKRKARQSSDKLDLSMFDEFPTKSA